MKITKKENSDFGETVPNHVTQSQRSNLSKAISVYNQGGVPIARDLDSTDDIDIRSIEGGFLVAITQFSNMKLQDGVQPSTITFESKTQGTFIVKRTEHFIGALLWRKDIGVSITQSKKIIIDLLNYLETSCDCEDVECVQSHVQQFTANLP
ncbi:MAG TPA: hypothetical protein VKM55_04700 [Candidatus Lokiarchaeia archaeon]|nr:hypothetical protein [Candidatus Lokiarchaeia archaeon]